MIEAFLDYALGPHGRAISNFYFENQMILNAVVVIGALSSMVLKRKVTSKACE
ncbi:MAG: hypothetical protein ACQER2_00860 [Bacillota bacterium]|jgi:hypothetical protein